jgi:hypothetical protein
MKTVVFDLDETLGYFVEMGVFWSCLEKYIQETNNPPISLEYFIKILDLYPEFSRPDIIKILNYLKNKKEKDRSNQIMLYTNNQGSKTWVNNIICYFEKKINYKLFDNIIYAFKINGKRIEMKRTTHDKTHSDLVRCTKIPLNTEICFIDDNYYPSMVHNKIYYVHIKPYVYELRLDEMITRLINSNILDSYITDKELFELTIKKEFKKFDYLYNEKSLEEYEIDKILSSKIIQHLNIFFNKSSTQNKTKKRTCKNKNKTTNKTHKQFLFNQT